jgi:DNA topoisomerase IB
MEKRHARLEPGMVIVFDYVAKGGQRRVQSVVDPRVYQLVAELTRRRGGGSDLLAFKEHGRWHDVVSSDINAYIKRVAGEEFTAKDFRTWTATVLAAVGVAVSGRGAATPTARKRAVARAVQEVAHYLGNTPAVCRASYIDPRVFDRFAAGETVAGALDALGDVDFGEPATQGPVEAAVIDLLSGGHQRVLAQAA